MTQALRKQRPLPAAKPALSEQSFAAWLLKPQSAHPATFQRVLQGVFATIGEPLLTVAAPDRFEVVLNELYDSPEAARAFSLLVEYRSVLDADAGEVGPTSTLRSDLSFYLGDVGFRTLSAGLPLLIAAIRTCAQLPTTATSGSIFEGAETDGRGIGERIDELQLPPPAYALLVEEVFGNFASLALLTAIETQTRLADWLGVLVADKIVSGMCAWLRLVANAPGISVDSTLVPKSEWLDLDEAAKDQKEARIGLGLLALGHSHTGKSVSAPFRLPGPTDEDE